MTQSSPKISELWLFNYIALTYFDMQSLLSYSNYQSCWPGTVFAGWYMIPSFLIKSLHHEGNEKPQEAIYAHYFLVSGDIILFPQRSKCIRQRTRTEAPFKLWNLKEPHNWQLFIICLRGGHEELHPGENFSIRVFRPKTGIIIWRAYFSLRGCVKLARAQEAAGWQETECTQPPERNLLDSAGVKLPSY